MAPITTKHADDALKRHITPVSRHTGFFIVCWVYNLAFRAV